MIREICDSFEFKSFINNTSFPVDPNIRYVTYKYNPYNSVDNACLAWFKNYLRNYSLIKEKFASCNGIYAFENGGPRSGDYNVIINKLVFYPKERLRLSKEDKIILDNVEAIYSLADYGYSWAFSKHDIAINGIKECLDDD